MLAEFSLLATKFPHSQHAERAKETAELLAQMIAEDKAHAAKPAKEFDKLTKAEQAAELVFELRDQNGQQWSQPGSCDIFLDPRGENSPASRLVAMGFDEATVRRVMTLVDRNEYKRRQAPPGVKITPRAFGRDRRFPLASKWRSAR